MSDAAFSSANDGLEINPFRGISSIIEGKLEHQVDVVAPQQSILHLITAAGEVKLNIAEGETIHLKLTPVDTGPVDPDPSDPISPPATGDGEAVEPPEPWEQPWYPQGGLDLKVRTKGELTEALEALRGVGGFLTLMSNEAAEALMDELQFNGLEGHERSYIVIRCDQGVVFQKSIRNIKGQLHYLCFEEPEFTPEVFGGLCWRLHGPHSDLCFYKPKVHDWNMVCEMKGTSEDPEAMPERIMFWGGDYSRIFNENAPIQTPQNAKNKSTRTQGFWFQAKDVELVGLTMDGIGWDVNGDPERTKTCVFDQIIYIAQRAERVRIHGCSLTRAANNAIVCKGDKCDITGNWIDQVVNAISLGTDESPEGPTNAFVSQNRIGTLIPLNKLDDPTLPDEVQIKANSGVAISLVNCGKVYIGDCSVKENRGRRNSFIMLGNNKSEGMEMQDVEVLNCSTEVTGMRIAEMRDYRRPTGGQKVAFEGCEGFIEEMLVRNTVPEGRADAAKGVTLNGQAISIA